MASCISLIDIVKIVVITMSIKLMQDIIKEKKKEGSDDIQI